jgi:hypothetical protein
MAALAILMAGDGSPVYAGTVQVAAPTQSADLIDQLRASGIVLTSNGTLYAALSATNQVAAINVASIKVGHPR